MAYTNPRGLPVAGDIGPTITTECACTLADYTAAGTTTPVVGDAVTFSATGSWYVARAGDEKAKGLGRVTKIDVAPVGTAVGYITVEWLDVIRFVELPCSVLANVTLGNSCEKAGDTATAADYDAPDAMTTTGSMMAVAVSAASGVGTIMAAVLGG